jgi:hypothetical protein
MSRKLVLVGAAVTAAAASAVAAYGAMSTGPIMGPASRIARPAFHGYYDGHKDTYLNTDVSSKALSPRGPARDRSRAGPSRSRCGPNS